MSGKNDKINALPRAANSKIINNLSTRGEQTKTTECCFWRSECAETRSNGRESCTHEQYDYVSRGKLDSAQDSAFRLRNIAVRGDVTDNQYRKRNYQRACPERQTLKTLYLPVAQLDSAQDSDS